MTGAVVFDIGNVLIHWAPEAYYDARIGAARRRDFFERVPIEAANLEIDAGAPFRETIYALAEAHPAWAAEIRAWHDDWALMAAPDIPETARLLRALRRHGVPVYALTNFGRETFDLAQEIYPVLTEFDRTFVSGRMGVVKPDAEIYARLERETGMAPGDLLFVDDKAENIAAARARGWRGHVFDGADGFGARLEREGLLDPGAAIA